MRKSIVGTVTACGLGVLAAGCYALALHEGRVDLKATTDRINAAIQPGGSFSYARSAIHPLSLGADLTRVVLRLPDGTLYTASHVSVSGAWGGRFASLHAEDVRGGGGALMRPLSVAALDGRNVSEPGHPMGGPWDPTAVTFDRMTFRDVAVAEGRSARMATVRIRNYGVGRPSTVELDDLSLLLAAPAYASRMAVSKVVSKGLDLAAAVKAYRTGTRDTQPCSPTIAELDGLSLGSDTTRIVAIGRTTVSATRNPVGDVTRVRMDMADAVYLPPKLAGLRSLEAILGDNPIRASVHQEASYARASGVFEMPSMTVRMEGIGTLGIAFRFSGIEPKFIEAPAETGRPMAQPVDMQLSNASAFFEDAGLMERVADVQARRLNLSRGEVRMWFANAVARNPVFAILPGGGGMRSAVAGFLVHGGLLRVALDPPSPLSVSALQNLKGSNAGTIASLLGLTVTHTESGDPP